MEGTLVSNMLLHISKTEIKVCHLPNTAQMGKFLCAIWKTDTQILGDICLHGNIAFTWINIWTMYFSIKNKNTVFLWDFGQKEENKKGKSNQAVTKSYRHNPDGS